MNASSLAMTLAEARVSLAWTRRVSLFAVGTVVNRELLRRSDMAGLRGDFLSSWPPLPFHPASFTLNMAPGLNKLFSESNSTRYGYRTSCLAGTRCLLTFAGLIALEKH